jgi:putative transferase (TIGR04331 family)
MVDRLNGRFLITTADERSWRFDRPVVFLGEWCRLFDRRDVWKDLDAKVVRYHWDDRKQAHSDYQHLAVLHESLLADLASALNDWHGTARSIRYWRVLVGPWLGYFTQIVFDRWVMVQRAAASESIAGTTVLHVPEGQMVPNDMSSFTEFFCGDIWNHHIFARILTQSTDIPWESSSVPATVDFTSGLRTAPQHSLRGKLKRLGSRFVFRVGESLSRRSDALLASTYLPVWQELRLNAALHQAPVIRGFPSPPRVPALPQLRRTFVLAGRTSPDFEGCIRSLIPEQIPTVYLEGYRQLLEHGRALPWPDRPKVIFTSNRHVYDEVFKAWAAEAVEKGAPLVIGQHGGHFGSGLWSFLEDHELAIADRYATWGWNDDNPKIRRVAALPLVGRGDGEWNPKGGLLLVTANFPRYSYWMYSTPLASQTARYLEDQFEFARALPESIQRQLLVRLYPVDYGWSQKSRWNNALPTVRVDSGAAPIEPLIRNCRLYVATYNATTFLETLGRNIPTVMYWNPKYWELRPTAEPYFAMLKEAGIFHDNPGTAAAKIGAIWDRVGDWWMSRGVQDARLAFCDRFARRPSHGIRELKRALTGF